MSHFFKKNERHYNGKYQRVVNGARIRMNGKSFFLLSNYIYWGETYIKLYKFQVSIFTREKEIFVFCISV